MGSKLDTIRLTNPITIIQSRLADIQSCLVKLTKIMVGDLFYEATPNFKIVNKMNEKIKMKE